MRECLHHGFDALYVAFQGSLSRKAIATLTREKARAKEAGKPSFAVVNGVDGHVGPTGASGGYAFKFDQGPLGAKWLIKDNDNPSEWNLFAEVPAIALMEYGVRQCIQNMWDDLKAFDARIVSNAVNRFDVAVDIEDENFRIHPERFSVHSHSTIQRHHSGENDDGTKAVIIGGSKIDTVTIGKMPNRQATIYNKRKQVVYSQKSHMWKFWGREKEETSDVWRVELRFGKKYLKKKGIVTLDDMLSRGGDLIEDSFEEIRYLDKPNDENVNATRTDMGGLWSLARDLLLRFCRGAMSDGAYVNVREVIRADHQKMCVTQIIGFFKNIAATKLDTPEFPTGEDPDERDGFIQSITDGVLRRLETIKGSAWDDFEDGVNRVRRKYHYLERAA